MRYFTALLLTLVCLLPAATLAQDAAPDEAALAEFAAPGPEHKQLMRLVGDWKAVMKLHMGSPEPLQTSEGTAKFSKLLGGRFLRQRFTGNIQGTEFVGIGMSGYDKSQKKYVGTWVDSMGTGMMHMTGTYDAEKHQLTEVGEAHSPEGLIKFKMTSDYVSNDKFIFTMYMVKDEGDVKWMVIDYTRAAEEQ